MNTDYWHGLEVDRGNQDEYPTAIKNPQQQHVDADYPRCVPSTSPENAAPGSKSRTCGLRKSTIWLMAALFIALVMGAIGVGVAGSLAANRKFKANHTLDVEAASSTNPASSTVSSSSHITRFTSIAPVATSTHPLSTAFDCHSLDSTYYPPVPFGDNGTIEHPIKFNIQCQSDYHTVYFMAMHMDTFEDCITACASYTTLLESSSDRNCTVATYKVSAQESCWLRKSNETAVPYYKPLVSSASIY